jgi:DNA-binding MarR family transcriptional regulator
MSPSDRRPKPLDRSEVAFWQSLMRALVVVPRVLDEDLDEAERLSVNQYSILVFLSEAPDRQMRIGQLAETTSLTISGITRLVNRMAADGLVERRRCEDDGRGFYAVLTEQGRERLERAYPTHLASARRHVMDHLAGFDLDALADAFMHFGDERYEVFTRKVPTSR